MAFGGAIVPFAAPPRAARGPGPRRTVRSEVFHVPAATRLDSGLPVIQDVLPEVMSTVGDRAQTDSTSTTYEAITVARRSAVQAVGVVFRGWRWEFRGLWPRCRSEDRRSYYDLERGDTAAARSETFV